MLNLCNVDHAIFNAPETNQNDVECDIVSPLNSHNAAQQSPTGGGPVPHQRLDNSWPWPPVASLLNVMGEVADIQNKKNRPVLVMCE